MANLGNKPMKIMGCIYGQSPFAIGKFSDSNGVRVL
jgi:hypothetical protein